MELEFYKIHTCQNDLILVSYLFKRDPPASELFPQIARSICRRHLGVGANGLVVLLPGIEHPIRMLSFLPTGRPAPLHNDALLATARYAFDSGIAGGTRVSMECADGIRTVDFIDSNNFRISIGTPMGLDSEEEIRETPNGEYRRTVEIDGKLVPLIPLFLQRPTVVQFAGDTPRTKLMRLSRDIRATEALSTPVHPVFCRVYSKDEIEALAWFRREAIDYTSAVGAAVVGSVLAGLTDREVIVHCNKQTLYVQWVQSSNEVLVTSAAEYLFSGTFYIEEERVQHRGPDF